MIIRPVVGRRSAQNPGSASRRVRRKLSARLVFQSYRVSAGSAQPRNGYTSCVWDHSSDIAPPVWLGPGKVFPELAQSLRPTITDLDPRKAGNGRRPGRRIIGWGWCPRRDSNSQTLRRRILNPLRLPFRHSGHRLTVYCLGLPASTRQRSSVRNVSQSAIWPDCSPVMNQRERCSDVPCVKVCGIGR